MIVILGIIGFHLLVILNARQSFKEKSLYIPTFFLTVLMVIYVVARMYMSEPPEG